MSAVVSADGEKFDTQVPLIIVGAGAAGLCAALAAKEGGIDAVVIERDDVPSGSTALSAGLIPAAGTRFQREKGNADSPAVFAADIQRKAKGEGDRSVVEAFRLAQRASRGVAVKLADISLEGQCEIPRSVASGQAPNAI